MNFTEGYFNSFDGSELWYKCFRRDSKKVVIFLHRGHEHSERLEKFMLHEQLESYTTYAYDYRGHGKSKEKTGPTYEFMDLVRDLDSFVKFVKNQENVNTKDIFIVANSVSGVVTSTWVHDYAPNIAGMALIAPAFEIKLYVPFAKEGLSLLTKLKPDLNIKSYVKSKYLTAIKEEQENYDNDPMISPDIPAKQLVSLLNTGERIVADANAITVPTILLSAGEDVVVNSKKQGDFFSKLSSENKKFINCNSSKHAILFDIGGDMDFLKITDFIQSVFSDDEIDIKFNSKKEILSNANDEKYMQDEMYKISYGSLPLCKSLSYAAQRISLKYLGDLSDGMKIGKKYGFDSGVTLDHVYDNKPSGVGFVGKAIDKNYLNSIGWKGIRQRRFNMVFSLDMKIQQMIKQGRKIKILDIAGGPGRYLIDIAKKYPEVEILVRDYQSQNIDQGEKLKAEAELTNINYEQADAFYLDSYKNMSFKPNIIVISGVFELFHNNSLIQNAIDGVSSIIEPEGYLFYTGQPWHPQLEQIANVLNSHQKGQWIMRRRSQNELDNLFSSAGFEKENMFIDNWGIFTVSTAKKI